MRVVANTSRYTGSNIIANVAYDLFTSSGSTTPEYEVMIWLSALGGAGPISSTGSPIASVNLAESAWKLYKGVNGQMTVFSFVADTAVEDFCGELMDFVDYLVDEQGVSDTQVLLSIGAGTEPFSGSEAVFKTERYSVKVNHG